MDKQTLMNVGEWAQSKVASGEEPPWTFHKYQQLADIALSLAEGFDATIAFTPDTEPNTKATLVNSKAESGVVSLTDFRRESRKLDVALPS